MTTDPLFPVLHTRPATGWINDPNGLCVHQGRWHVFAQVNPAEPVHRDVHWWHAVSDDLLRFDDLGIALAPSHDDTRPDRDGIWSGNAVSHGDRIVAYYSAFDSREPLQPPMAAVGTGTAGTTLVPGDTVVAALPAEVVLEGETFALHTCRDPFVLPDRDGDDFLLLMGAGLESDSGQRRAAVLRFRGDDPAATFAYDGVLHHRRAGGGAAEPADTGEMWECPAMARPIERGSGRESELLIVSSWYREAGTAYPVAMLSAGRAFGETADGGAEDEMLCRRLDDGDAFYAPSLTTAPDGRIVLWGWATERRPQEDWMAGGWAGSLTFPRELTVEDGDVHMVPAAELDALRLDRLTPPAGLAGPGELATTAQAELLLTGEPGCGPAAVTLTSAETVLVVSTERVAVDHETVAVVDGHRMTLARPGDREVRLRVLLDGSVVEAFTGAGRAVTTRTYPVGHTGWDVSVTLGEGWRLDAWTLAL